MSDIHIIENEYLKIKVTSLGATLMSFYDKKHDVDMVGGFDTVDDYLKRKDIFFGSTVGRCVNWIKDGKFTINGITYQTDRNNNGNSLHGGNVPFSYQEFNIKEVNDNSITLSYFSKDGEAGYPGNLTLEVTYELKGKELIYKFNGISDKDTIFNISNHSYFNLTGNKENIDNHEMYLPCKKVSLGDETSMPTGEDIDVEDTAFDFNTFRTFKDSFNQGHPNMFGGIDHSFIQEHFKDDLKVQLRYNGITISIHSDLPCVEIYTSNYFDDFKGKDGLIYGKHSCVAIEPDYAPNAINWPKYIQPIIKANEKVYHYIRYKVED